MAPIHFDQSIQKVNKDGVTLLSDYLEEGEKTSDGRTYEEVLETFPEQLAGIATVSKDYTEKDETPASTNGVGLATKESVEKALADTEKAEEERRAQEPVILPQVDNDQSSTEKKDGDDGKESSERETAPKSSDDLLGEKTDEAPAGEKTDETPAGEKTEEKPAETVVASDTSDVQTAPKTTRRARGTSTDAK